MKLSTKGQYAVEALLYMAIHDDVDRWNIKVIAEKTAIKERYLEQIFHLLRKADILDTIRGPKGGYFISKDIKTLKIGEIIRAVEGDITPVPCVDCRTSCSCDVQDICATRGLWYRVEEAINQVIDFKTLYELVLKYNGVEEEIVYENFD